MSINFSDKNCQDYSDNELFGLCDDRPGHRAYIDEKDGKKWIAVVVNEDRYEVTFTAIDNCIEIVRADGKMDKRCDGFLSYNSTITFVELKERGATGNAWVTDGEKQLRTSIQYFKASGESENFTKKRAYLANSEHPKFKESQSKRMGQFLIDTGYVLRIENRIIL